MSAKAVTLLLEVYGKPAEQDHRYRLGHAPRDARAGRDALHATGGQRIISRNGAVSAGDKAP
jgi:hypothetical protein